MWQHPNVKANYIMSINLHELDKHTTAKSLIKQMTPSIYLALTSFRSHLTTVSLSISMI